MGITQAASAACCCVMQNRISREMCTCNQCMKFSAHLPLQVSCSWGYTTGGGAKGVGESTTSAVVISLVAIFILDFLLRWGTINLRNRVVVFGWGSPPPRARSSRNAALLCVGAMTARRHCASVLARQPVHGWQLITCRGPLPSPLPPSRSYLFFQGQGDALRQCVG